MPYRNNQTGEYELDRPHRVRFANGLTATGPEVTEKMLKDAGWKWEDHPVPPDPNTAVIHTTTSTGTTS